MPFESISTTNILVAFLTLSAIIAMISTNIHKNAISNFISFLCDKAVLEKDNAKSLTEMNIKGLSAIIIKSSMNSSTGISKYVNEVIPQKKSNDKLEALLEGGDECKYYLYETDTDALKKKYYYRPLSFKYILLFVAAIIITAILSTAAVEYLLTNHTRNISQDKEEQIEEKIDESTDDEGMTNDDFSQDSTQDENEFIGPTIPV